MESTLQLKSFQFKISNNKDWVEKFFWDLLEKGFKISKLKDGEEACLVLESSQPSKALLLDVFDLIDEWRHTEDGRNSGLSGSLTQESSKDSMADNGIDNGNEKNSGKDSTAKTGKNCSSLEKGIPEICLSQPQYELALNWFKHFPLWDFLDKAVSKQSGWVLQLENKESYIELEKFLNQIQKASIPQEYIQQLKDRWGPKIVFEFQNSDESMSIYTTWNIYRELQNILPGIETNGVPSTKASGMQSQKDEIDSSSRSEESPARAEETQGQRSTKSKKSEQIFKFTEDIYFKPLQFQLARKIFTETKMQDCFLNAHHEKSIVYMFIEDEDIAKKLKNFKKNLREQTVSYEKADLYNQIKHSWADEVCEESCGGSIVITGLKKTLEEIERQGPGVFAGGIGPSTETGHSGSVDVRSVGNQKGITHPNENNGGWEKIEPSKRRFDSQLHNLCVVVYNADITSLQADVIVNPSNQYLHHGGGLAMVIANKAGHQLTKECDANIKKHRKVKVSHHFASTGGNLAVKEVYHAVGPMWSQYGKDKALACQRDLRLTLLRCLVHAERKGHKDIIFPSISASVSKVPVELCVKSYVKAVQHFKYWRQHYGTGAGSLREVHFVDISDNMVNDIAQHFKDNFQITIHQNCQDFTEDLKSVKEYLQVCLSQEERNWTSPSPPGGATRSTDLAPSTQPARTPGMSSTWTRAVWSNSQGSFAAEE